MIDISKITDIHLEGMDSDDHPDYKDAHIGSANYDGQPMSKEMLEELNEDVEYLYQQVLESAQYKVWTTLNERE